MLVRFWGVRGSIAKPGPDTVRYGGNTSCVEVRSASGTLLVLDCGTGALALGQSLARNGRKPLTGHMLIGHTHWDHIQGFPFFEPLFAAGNEWHIYGPRGGAASLRDSLATQMQYSYFPVTLDDLAASVRYHDLVEGTFEAGDIHVTSVYLNHPALTLGYRLEADGMTLVYSTDHEPHAAGPLAETPTGEEGRHARFLAGADLVIHDAQYTGSEYPAKRGWGHSPVEYAVDIAAAAGVRRLALFHHDPMRSDAALDEVAARMRERAAKISAMEVFAAAEGQVVDLGGDDSAAARTELGSEPCGSARWSPALEHAMHAVVVAVANPLVRGVLIEAITEGGLRVLPVTACGAIASIVRAERPSLVVLEEDRSDCDVAEICQALRGEAANLGDDVPIVLVGTRQQAADTPVTLPPGATDRLVYPFSREYARTRVNAWVLRHACRWTSAEPHADEEARLRAVHQTGLLDTDPEERFDRLTRITAALFKVPIALITLVDRDRQWFKSRHGLDLRETARDRAFCAHAILRPDVMQVSDALEDERFAENPLVRGNPRIRFYAGAPLVLRDGSPVGTLCVIDHRARLLDEGQLGLLSDLSKLVERELAIGSPVKARERRGDAAHVRD